MYTFTQSESTNVNTRDSLPRVTTKTRGNFVKECSIPSRVTWPLLHHSYINIRISTQLKIRNAQNTKIAQRPRKIPNTRSNREHIRNGVLQRGPRRPRLSPAQRRRIIGKFAASSSGSTGAKTRLDAGERKAVKGWRN